ncbi:hypothetical protein GA840_09335 [Pediococcus ethanolidurans]|uniref:hypothetical protein n=1 Tax=Pediococcus ethanolidurans TaxID=319653 RepID=UPI0029549A7C|nr:hypothetical protein [Pediococcus ethanolidurans]MDV7720048.1 hypothetical protein [Pediococcus ethanolidurans]
MDKQNKKAVLISTISLIIIALVTLAFVFIHMNHVAKTNKTINNQALQSVRSSKNHSSFKKRTSIKKTVVITKKSFDTNNNAAAAAIFSYAADNIKDINGWSGLKKDIKKKYTLDIVANGKNNIKYYYHRYFYETASTKADAGTQPYYKITGNNNDQIIFYTINNKKLAKVSLVTIFNYVNQHINKVEWQKIIKLANVTNNTDTNNSNVYDSSNSFTKSQAIKQLKKAGADVSNETATQGNDGSWSFGDQGQSWVAYADGANMFPGDAAPMRKGTKGYVFEAGMNTENDARRLIGGANADLKAKRYRDEWVFSDPSGSNFEITVTDSDKVSNNSGTN